MSNMLEELIKYLDAGKLAGSWKVEYVVTHNSEGAKLEERATYPNGSQHLATWHYPEADPRA